MQQQQQEQDTRLIALQSIALAERYQRRLERARQSEEEDRTASPTPSPSSEISEAEIRSPPYLSVWHERWLATQKQRGLELLEQLRRRDDQLVNSVVDLTLARRQDEVGGSVESGASATVSGIGQEGMAGSSN
jgi:hypothetical protein